MIGLHGRRWEKKRCGTCAYFDAVTWRCSGMKTLVVDGEVRLASKDYQGPALPVKVFPDFGCNGHYPLALATR